MFTLQYMIYIFISKAAPCTPKRALLIPQIGPAHKYPNSPWEMIHPPGGDNAVCM
jgi:hypothetical protein